MLQKKRHCPLWQSVNYGKNSQHYTAKKKKETKTNTEILKWLQYRFMAYMKI